MTHDAQTCGAHLYIADSYGDNEAVMRCQLEVGHEGPHQAVFQRQGDVTVTWWPDERLQFDRLVKLPFDDSTVVIERASPEERARLFEEALAFVEHELDFSEDQFVPDIQPTLWILRRLALVRAATPNKAWAQAIDLCKRALQNPLLHNPEDDYAEAQRTAATHTLDVIRGCYPEKA